MPTNSIVHSEPTVTIAIPVLNEAANIRHVLNAFTRTQYKQVVEIFVIDGGSDDLTVDIVREYSQLDDRVRLLHNPKRYQAYALNAALEVASGEVFLRADGHCRYAEDYVDRCVEVLVESGAANVGGAQRMIADVEFQLAVALAGKSLLGSGGARYRDSNYEGWADTVFLGCFWTQALRSIGGFDPTMQTNEDYFANVSLRTSTYAINVNDSVVGHYRAGGVYISPRIRVWYFPRDTFQRLWKQYWRYGRGRCLTSLRRRMLFARGNVPVAGMVALAVFCAADYFFGHGTFAWVSLCGGGLLIAFESARVVISVRGSELGEIWHGELPPRFIGIRTVSLVAIAIVTMNLAHCLGFGFQLFRTAFTRRLQW